MLQCCRSYLVLSSFCSFFQSKKTFYWYSWTLQCCWLLDKTMFCLFSSDGPVELMMSHTNSCPLNIVCITLHVRLHCLWRWLLNCYSSSPMIGSSSNRQRLSALNSYQCSSLNDHYTDFPCLFLLLEVPRSFMNRFVLESIVIDW